jgi:hypothetical protein
VVVTRTGDEDDEPAVRGRAVRHLRFCADVTGLPDVELAEVGLL